MITPPCDDRTLEVTRHLLVATGDELPALDDTGALIYVSAEVGKPLIADASWDSGKPATLHRTSLPILGPCEAVLYRATESLPEVVVVAGDLPLRMFGVILDGSLVVGTSYSVEMVDAAGPFMWSYDRRNGRDNFGYGFHREGSRYEVTISPSADLRSFGAVCTRSVNDGDRVDLSEIGVAAPGQRTLRLRPSPDGTGWVADEAGQLLRRTLTGFATPLKAFEAILPALPAAPAGDLGQPDSRLRGWAA
jgi:hypothetical protein